MTTKADKIKQVLERIDGLAIDPEDKQAFKDNLEYATEQNLDKMLSYFIRGKR